MGRDSSPANIHKLEIGFSYIVYVLYVILNCPEVMPYIIIVILYEN